MTKEKVNELAIDLIEKNTNWAFDEGTASRDFAQFTDGILMLRSRIVEEIEKEESHKEFEEGFLKAMGVQNESN